MRDFLRFVFSAADQANIDPASLVVQDVAYAAAPNPAQPYPQSLRITLRSDATKPWPQIRPLFPGKLEFIADAAAPGATPSPAEVDFTPAAYAGWRTRGMLKVTLDPRRQGDLKAHAAGLEVFPNIVWYSPVRVTSDFLFTTLRNGLRREPVPLVAGGSIATGHADWAKHAVAGFLAGHYQPSLRLGANAAADDVAAHAMPTIEPTAVMTGDAELVVTTAFTRTPQDAPDGNFDALAPGVGRENPAHPAHGVLPARHVYRMARNHLIDATPAAAATVLADWGQGPRYFAFRFMRTWQAIENCSVHFPAQRVRVDARPGGALLAEQRLPAHGVFYLKQDPPPPPPALVPNPPQVRVRVAGDMRWLDGATADSWRVKGATQPVDFDLSAVPPPHICLRLPMSEEIMVEPDVRPGGALCTYLSMRRSVRALVDNRICGGRLSFGVGSTSKPTRDLMTAAWAGTAATANMVADNRPASGGPAGLARTHLEPILSAFFPDTQPGHTLDDGEIAYNIWQSNLDVFSAAATQGNFNDAQIGRGAAGALVFLNLTLGGDFEIDPSQGAGETDDAYCDRVVGDMLAGGLRPGAALQFWRQSIYFEYAKTRPHPAGSLEEFRLPPWKGHSPLFVRYTTDAAGNRNGIRVIDQYAESDCPVETTASGSRRLAWHENQIEIWTAANWEE
ncbi:MAG: hypothetical protein ACT4OM_07970 [Actinomycetota bacterium]